LFELTSEALKSIIHKKYERIDLQPVQDWIRIHCLETISLEKIANYFNYNKYYLTRVYKKSFGIGIFEQITKFRLKHAKELLIETNLSTVEIASKVGYEDSKYFMRIFRKHEGITPTQYRKAFCQKHYNKV
jgi:YesN/AraC family two-component response regulator